MNVFITGATGYVGYAVAQKFNKKGHAVTGLVRSKANADKLAAAGIQPVIGNLENPESFAADLPQFDAVIHAGFAADPNKGAEYSIETERKLVNDY